MRVISHRQAVPSPPQKTVLFPRVISPRQTVPRLPQEITLSHQQRVSFSRQAVPSPPWKTVLFPRVISPRQVVLSLHQRTTLFRLRVLYFPRQSGVWQGLGQVIYPGRQALPLGWTTWSLSLTVLFSRWHLPRPVLPRKQGLSTIGITLCRVLTPWRNLTQSG